MISTEDQRRGGCAPVKTEQHALSTQTPPRPCAVFSRPDYSTPSTPGSGPSGFHHRGGRSDPEGSVEHAMGSVRPLVPACRQDAIERRLNRRPEPLEGAQPPGSNVRDVILKAALTSWPPDPATTDPGRRAC